MTWRRVGLGVAAVVLTGIGIWLWGRLLTEVLVPPQVAGHHDFFAFYAAAQLMSQHTPAGVYDAGALTAAERAILNAPVGAAGYMPYLNPPFAAAAQTGLANVSETAARLLWLGITLLAAVLALWLALRPLGRRAALFGTLAMLLSFPTYQNLVEGQWSFVLLLGLVAALHQRGARSGAFAAVLWLKPPLALLLGAWGIATAHWRLLAGLLAALVVAVVVFLPLTGAAVYAHYIDFLWQVSLSHVSGAGASGTTAWEGGLPQMEGINGLVAAYVGQAHPLLDDVVTGVADCGLLAAVAALLGWERIRRPGPWAAAALVLTGLLLDPHLYAQDLVLAVLLLPLLARWVKQPGEVLIGAVLLLDLAVLDTEWSPSWPVPLPPHLLTWALVGTAVWLARASRRHREDDLSELAAG